VRVVGEAELRVAIRAMVISQQLIVNDSAVGRAQGSAEEPVAVKMLNTVH
jgi:hypothetical protein